MATSFPLTELTANQRETFQTYIEARRDSERALKEPLWFALVLAREKPALLMVPDFTPPQSVSWDPMGECDPLEQVVPPDKEITAGPFEDNQPEPPITIEALTDVFALKHRKFNGSICVARTSWLLDLLPTSKGSANYHRRLGTIFGYPQADIEHFLTAETLSPQTHPEEFVATGCFQPEELAYTAYLPQVHEDSIAGYERAISTGKEIRETVSTLADQWKVPEIDSLSESIYENA